MNKILIALLAISIVGNVAGMYFFYKHYKLKQYTGLERNRSLKTIQAMTGTIDDFLEDRMVFLHHSVGSNILSHGGLRDSLSKIGISVKGATYGDEIGNNTDINHWLPKFQNDIEKVFKFRVSPNNYYADDKSNNIVMFKSCFPNSNLVSEGDGDPSGFNKTIANYKAVFGKIRNEISKYPDKLFVYMTAPPLVPKLTTQDNAARARQFNEWLLSDFLPEYESSTGNANLLIFDLFDVLADTDNLLKSEFRKENPGDSHPNLDGSKHAAAKFMEFFRPLWDAWKTEAQQTETPG